jgi:hypothetical protein
MTVFNGFGMDGPGFDGRLGPSPQRTPPSSIHLSGKPGSAHYLTAIHRFYRPPNAT